MSSGVLTNQRGSVVTYLIVGVVLAGITLAAIYFAQHRGDSPQQAPSGSPSPVVQQPSSSVSSSPSPSVSVSSRQSPSTTPAPTSGPQTTHMPQTGPTDNLMVIAIPAAVMTGLLVSFIRSRRLHL